MTQCSHTLSCLSSISASLLFSRSVAFYSSGSQIFHVDNQSCEAHIPTGCSLSCETSQGSVGNDWFYFSRSLFILMQREGCKY